MAEHTPLQHTPLPWRTSEDGLRMMIRGDDAKIVALRHRLDRHEHEANFQLIIKAVNNHEALVKELEEQREWLAGRSTSAMLQGFPVDDAAQDRIESINRVLTAVVGGASK